MDKLTKHQEEKYHVLRDLGWEYEEEDGDNIILVKREYIGDSIYTNGRIAVAPDGSFKAAPPSYQAQAS